MATTYPSSWLGVLVPANAVPVAGWSRPHGPPQAEPWNPPNGPVYRHGPDPFCQYPHSKRDIAMGRALDSLLRRHGDWERCPGSHARMLRSDSGLSAYLVAATDNEAFWAREWSAVASRGPSALTARVVVWRYVGEAMLKEIGS